MYSEHFLLELAIILLFTKILGLATKRFKMPQVVGALLAGVVLGPAGLNFLRETDFLNKIADLGVIILMFSAGIETDIASLKRTWRKSLVIALMGICVPLLFGMAVGTWFYPERDFLQHVFIGIILTATSVSITVETLKEMGKISTKAGNAILGAALIDDILGIVGLTIVTSMAGSEVSIPIVLGKIIGFFMFAGVVGFFVKKMFAKWVNHYQEDLRRFVIISFVICLLLSFVAEAYFGVAEITGAFIAGLIIANTEHTHYIEARFSTLSYILLSPIFFASIGLQVELPEMNATVIVFTLVLIITAIISKIFGCGLAARFCGYTNQESLQIGTGMVSRGEVALIMVAQGVPLGLMTTDLFAPVIIMVIVTTIVSPILLKLAFEREVETATV
ncbi:MAG: cation:proton antiporter [Bacillota bacterium]